MAAAIAALLMAGLVESVRVQAAASRRAAHGVAAAFAAGVAHAVNGFENIGNLAFHLAALAELERKRGRVEGGRCHRQRGHDSHGLRDIIVREGGFRPGRDAGPFGASGKIGFELRLFLHRAEARNLVVRPKPLDLAACLFLGAGGIERDKPGKESSSERSAGQP